MKKGFTLIELLAVIVILAVIALIAVPIILSLVDKSRTKAAEESMLFYVDTIENMLMINNVENTDGKTYKVKGRTVVDEKDTVVLNLEIKGDVPDSGVANEITISNGFIERANLRFHSYYVHYEMDRTTKKFKTCTSQKGFLDTCDETGEVKPTEPDGSEENVVPTVLQVGQYVQIIPSKTTYTITGDMTGCTGGGDTVTSKVCPAMQTIHPSELTLWRVLKVNEDGTYDMISEYVSSTKVYFSGEVGFRKFVGTLNNIAAQYTDNKYITKTRYMGFNGQIEELTGSITAGTPTSENTGGGDNLYINDTELVASVYETLKASPVNETEKFVNYWLATRKYSNNGIYSGGLIMNEGVGANYFFVYGQTSGIYAPGQPVRPIVTLAQNFAITGGKGDKGEPYILK